jgi:hypothetical protein
MIGVLFLVAFATMFAAERHIERQPRHAVARGGAEETNR